MKLIISTLFILNSLFSLNVSTVGVDITYGRGTACQGRGLCSIESANTFSKTSAVLYYDQVLLKPIKLSIPIGNSSIAIEKYQLQNDSIFLSKEMKIYSGSAEQDVTLDSKNYRIFPNENGYVILF